MGWLPHPPDCLVCRSFFGYSHLTGGWDGGQAEYARVPYADLNCLKVGRRGSRVPCIAASSAACKLQSAARPAPASWGLHLAAVPLLRRQCSHWCNAMLLSAMHLAAQVPDSLEDDQVVSWPCMGKK